MRLHLLENLFVPKRLAVLGLDSSEPFSTSGMVLLKNLVASGFSGTIYPVHPVNEGVLGMPAWPDVRHIPKAVDMAVLTGEPARLLKDIEACGKQGIKAVVILANDFRHRVSAPDEKLAEISALCKRFHMRCLGPNSLGFIRPKLGLNVSTGRQGLRPGNLAFISQSATLAAGIMDYAIAKHIGFSAFISLGAQIDVDFADCLDFLGMDPETKAIVMYMESVPNGRRFVGAARAFARAKPLVVVKGGRFDASAKAAITHSGVLAGADKVYDAIFKRAGIVRVEEVIELFHLAETLSRHAPPVNNRLVIVSNAGGPALMATDTLIRYGGKLASFDEKVVSELRQSLPEHAALGNPVDLLSDASPERFKTVFEICLRDVQADGILVIVTPQFATRPVETASAIVELSRKYRRKTVLACWMGTGEFERARDILNHGDIATFVAPEQAIKSFAYMYNYARNINLLYETPANLLEDFYPNSEIVEGIMRDVAEQGRLLLKERESKALLAAYGIPSPPVELAQTVEEALSIAERLGFPVAMKLESPDITHKRKVGGVHLHVTKDKVAEVFEAIRSSLSDLHPDAKFDGVAIQPMVLWPGVELAIGAKKDPTFGSVVVFGTGGQLFETIGDYAIGIPPLNQTLVRRLLEDTKISRLLEEKAGAKYNIDALETTLLRFSVLISDFPQIREVDINPFYLGEKGGVCLDARIVLEEDALSGIVRAQGPCCPENLVICPYPCHYIDTGFMNDGVAYLIRPIKPEDEPLMQEFFSMLSPETILFRFFQPIASISHDQMVRYCQIDYDREIAIVVVINKDGKETIIGVGRLTILPDAEGAEFATVVGDSWQGHGLGWQLMKRCLEIARFQGLKHLEMDILVGNSRMKGLAEKAGFTPVPSQAEELWRYRLDLTAEKTSVSPKDDPVSGVGEGKASQAVKVPARRKTKK